MISVFMILSGFYILEDDPDINKTVKRILKCCILFIEAKLIYQFINLHYEWIDPPESFFSFKEISYLFEFYINPVK